MRNRRCAKRIAERNEPRERRSAAEEYSVCRVHLAMGGSWSVPFQQTRRRDVLRQTNKQEQVRRRSFRTLVLCLAIAAGITAIAGAQAQGKSKRIAFTAQSKATGLNFKGTITKGSL